MHTVVRISADNWPSDIYKKVFPSIKDAWRVKALSKRRVYRDEIVKEQTVYIKGWNVNLETKSSQKMSAD